MMVRWRLLGCGGKDEGGPLLRSSTDCSKGLLFSEPGTPLSAFSMSYLQGLAWGWRPTQQGPSRVGRGMLRGEIRGCSQHCARQRRGPGNDRTEE